MEGHGALPRPSIRCGDAHTPFLTHTRLESPGMGRTILVVDDVRNIREMVATYLQSEGFRVVTAADGRQALDVARREDPELVVLDIMMPEMDGYEFMRTFRRERDTPVILLTAKIDETDKVLGLDLGADDYVTKPFGMRELTARIRAVLRREARTGAHGRVLRAADVALDPSGRTVTVDARRVDLTPSEFALLAALMSSPGHVFSRLDLLEQIQGNVYEGYERTIDVHVRNLRSKIEPDPRHPRYVETVYGVGYRFAAEP
jgi:DNA-binding response OmpR family regulator